MEPGGAPLEWLPIGAVNTFQAGSATATIHPSGLGWGIMTAPVRNKSGTPMRRGTVAVSILTAVVYRQARTQRKLRGQLSC